MRHLLNPLDFSVEETNALLELAIDIENNRGKYSKICEGKKLATLFYEPSTRTRLSFEAAMLNLAFILPTHHLQQRAKALQILSE